MMVLLLISNEIGGCDRRFSALHRGNLFDLVAFVGVL